MNASSPSRRAITVFAASSMADNESAVMAVEEVVDACSHHGAAITFGGARVGLMGILAERAANAGVPTTGVIPSFLTDREPPSEHCTFIERVDTMARRKQRMFATNGLCVLPGGFGTLDETFEAITLKQLRQIAIPIALINVGGYFDFLLEFISACETRGSIVLEGRDTFRVFTDPSSAVDYLCI